MGWPRDPARTHQRGKPESKDLGFDFANEKRETRNEKPLATRHRPRRAPLAHGTRPPALRTTGHRKARRAMRTRRLRRERIKLIAALRALPLLTHRRRRPALRT